MSHLENLPLSERAAYCALLSREQRHCTLNVKQIAIYVDTLHQPGFTPRKAKNLFTSKNRLFRLDNVNKHPVTGKVMQRRRRATVADIDRVMTAMAGVTTSRNGMVMR